MHVKKNQNLSFGTLIVKVDRHKVKLKDFENIQKAIVKSNTLLNDPNARWKTEKYAGVLYEVSCDTVKKEKTLAERLRRFGAQVVYTITGNGKCNGVQQRMENSLTKDKPFLHFDAPWKS